MFLSTLSMSSIKSGEVSANSLSAPCKRSWSLFEDNRLRMLINQHGLDWKTVTEHMPDRTTKQCRERWTNVLNPALVKTDFSEKEDQLIIEMQAKIGNRWSEIAHMLNGRSDVSVKNRFAKLKLQTNKKSPTPKIYYNPEREAAIALTEFTKVRSSTQSDETNSSDNGMSYNNSLVNTGKVFIKRSWTSHEDNCLRQYVKNHGENNWKLITQYISDRSLKQCRERWTLTLNPRIRRDAWTAEEDEIIVKTQQEIGNRWVDIARLLPGRVDISVKNRFFKLKNMENKKGSDFLAEDDTTTTTTATDDNDDDSKNRTIASELETPQTPETKTYILKHPKKRLLDHFETLSPKVQKVSETDNLTNSDKTDESSSASCNSSITSSQDRESFSKTRRYDSLLPNDNMANLHAAMSAHCAQLPSLSLLLQQPSGIPSIPPLIAPFHMSQYPMMQFPPHMMGYPMMPFPFQTLGADGATFANFQQSFKMGGFPFNVHCNPSDEVRVDEEAETDEANDEEEKVQIVNDITEDDDDDDEDEDEVDEEQEEEEQ